MFRKESTSRLTFRRGSLFSLALAIGAARLVAQTQLTPGVQGFLSFNDPVVALMHVRLIDGEPVPSMIRPLTIPMS